MGRGKGTDSSDKKVERYEFDDIKEPRTPETGHTASLPTDEEVLELSMDYGWGKAIHIGHLPADDRTIIFDIDPVADPTLLWAGKRNKIEIPVLPLQRNEIISESRIAQIIERARNSKNKEEKTRQTHLFANLEKSLRDRDRNRRVDFYKHEEGWKNKLICGDSLHVIESLLHYENLGGKVQMIYIDPPYAIKYNSNFQQRIDTTKNDPKDTADDVISINAYRDTWILGVHSWLEHLAERLYLSRKLLRETGSIFIQINDEHLHRVKLICDEVFGSNNYIRTITFRKKSMPLGGVFLEEMNDYLIWYAKDKTRCFFSQLYREQDVEGLYYWDRVELPDGTKRRLTSEERANHKLLPSGSHVARLVSMVPPTFSEKSVFPFTFNGEECMPPEGGCWITNPEGMQRLADAGRLVRSGKSLMYFYRLSDFPFAKITAQWLDTGTGNFSEKKLFAVQTSYKVIERCLLMTTVPGDIVFDPTCGSGTTAWCAEKWGRRWITCDFSRVALNVARQRLLSAVLPMYKLVDNTVTSGFKLTKVPRTTLRSIANALEPEGVEMPDRPEVDKDTIRVCGPIEVLSLGRYSLEDWKGDFVNASSPDEPAKLSNYIEVICRLYRKDAAIQTTSGLVHAVAETEEHRIAISVGPLSGRVTAKQISDAVRDARASGILETHVLGWAFEANVGEVKSTLEKPGNVKIELIMIRPDTLAEGLKATRPEMLFSPLALPDIEVEVKKKDTADREVSITLHGIALFDRKRRTTDYKPANSGYISAWYLDEDYDGDCFVDCQMFFDFKQIPRIEATFKAKIDPKEFKLQLESKPFPVGEYRRIAVKVVDVYGNESTVVRDIV